MKLIHSDMLPLGLYDNQESISECLKKQFLLADQVEIAVGYVSKASLIELEELVEKNKISNICLTIGMYYVEGMPESSYRTALAINKKWMKNGVGEIRMVKSLKYHGKLYCLYKNGSPISSIIGSANLGVMKLEASNRRQFEACVVSFDVNECKEISELVKRIQEPQCSVNIADIQDLKLIREINNSLNNIETVEQIPQSQVQLYEKYKTNTSFILPLKVPKFEERHMDDGKHYTKSNLNVCYAAPRTARKSRDWYETQLTVSKAITRIKGYPKKNEAFFVVTDDGYTFKVHTTSDGNKQFSAVGNELIMGRWLKGRLVAAGLVSPVNDTGSDFDRKGMITKEMLEDYGCDQVVLTKTSQKILDENKIQLDVWILSFESSQSKE